MDVQVSVIIPVYNAERYLERCIASLLRQTLHACEFIFVDDGSKDRSAEMIRKHQQTDDRIKLIQQENQGVSMARNKGIAVSSGEYLGFVDADDDIEPDMYEVLFRAAKQDDCDVVISNFESEMDQHLNVTRYPFPVNTLLDSEYARRELLPYFIQKDDLNTACSKLYKSAVVRENGIQFPQNVALGEDGMFNVHVFRCASAIKYLDYTGYHYREVSGSATRNILNKDYFKQAKAVYLTDWTGFSGSTIDQANIKRWQSVKFISSVMSYIYIYFNSSDQVGFRQRYAYVRKMIHDHHVREALLVYRREAYSSLGRYDKLLVQFMQLKITWGLFLATAYSRYRSK